MDTLTSNQYNWNDISVVVGGRPLFGLRSITVKHGYTHTQIYASGGKAHAINEGNHSVSGSIKCLQSEYDNLVTSYGQDEYQKKYFDIVWVFAPKSTDDAVKTHIIKNAKFGESELTLSQDEEFMEVEIPFMALDIKLNT